MKFRTDNGATQIGFSARYSRGMTYTVHNFTFSLILGYVRDRKVIMDLALVLHFIQTDGVAEGFVSFHCFLSQDARNIISINYNIFFTGDR